MEQLELILTDFQGPLDLLLHLIKRSQINIYDIPIAQITQQYLDYLHQMQSLQLDIAGDYLVMAATLMRIKSQLLLPQDPIFNDDVEVDDEIVDPRSDLVAQLLNYQVYQTIAEKLKILEQNRRQLFNRPATVGQKEVKLVLKPQTYSGNDLALCFVGLLDRIHQQQKLAQLPQKETISVTQAQTQILEKLGKCQQATFQELLQRSFQIEEVVTKFMGLLELIKKQMVVVSQINFQADIWVKLR